MDDNNASPFRDSNLHGIGSDLDRIGKITGKRLFLPFNFINAK